MGRLHALDLSLKLSAEYEAHRLKAALDMLEPQRLPHQRVPDLPRGRTFRSAAAVSPAGSVTQSRPMSAGHLAQDRSQRLIEVGRGLLSELDLDTVLDRVLETARELTGARYAALGILDERRRELAQFLTRGIDARTHREIGDLPRGRGILGLLIDDPRPIRISDVGEHRRSYGFPPAHPPMRSFLGVPIVIRGEAWGNLYLTEKDAGEFDQDDEDATVVLADWAAIAIENARLYRAVDSRREELERAVRGFEATATIARAVGGETDLDRILELIVKRGRALMEARDVLILLWEGDALVVAAGAGDVAAEAPSGVRIPGARWDALLGDRRARRVSDIEAQLRISPADLGVVGAESALIVPLVYRGTALGVLAVFDRLTGDGQFTTDDEEVLKAFAASGATAVATAKSVEADRLRRSLEAAEAERRRWARELHDETLQGLGGLNVLLSSAARLEDPAAMRDAMRGAGEHVAQEIENLRAIIAELRPAALDQLGLGPALTSLAQRTASTHGLDVRTDLALGDADARLPPELETTVYRLVQEALSNVMKHAAATRVDISVREQGGAVHVRVADDGRGFDPSTPSAGFGLVGMRERAELSGGELQIEAGEPGTVVRARLPVR
jgi:signal transduction histidine kinase